MNEQSNDHSPSAYASAQTSPTPSLASSGSTHSLQHTSSSSSESTATASKLPNSMSLNLIQFNDPEPASSSVPSVTQPPSDGGGKHRSPPVVATMINSFSLCGISQKMDDESAGATSLIDDYQSLPVKPSSNEDMTVKEIIDQTVKVTMDSETSPNSKKAQQRSSVLSLFGRMFTKSNTTDAKKKDDMTTASTSTATTSSPNPESSPYKLLTEEKKEEESSLEKLASLNHQEQEKIDPVVRGTTPVKQQQQSTTTETAAGDQEKTEKESSPHAEPTAIKDKVTAAKVDSDENKGVLTVPASSQEFCMDLHLNLAAASQQLPVVNSEPAVAAPAVKNTVLSPSRCINDDHNRFTKNASTSSIHNDLKMILEDSKPELLLLSSSSKPAAIETPTETQPAVTATSTSKSESSKHEKEKEKEAATAAPKPQRTHKSKSKSKSHKSSSASAAVTATASSELARIMIQMKNENVSSANRQHRYSKEFLTKVKEERAEIISKICPDIFKAYCYCMTGKYWDPEKYFDIVQYSGDFDKITSQRTRNVNVHVQGNVGAGGFQQANRNQHRINNNNLPPLLNNQPIYRKVNNVHKPPYNNNNNNNLNYFNSVPLTKPLTSTVAAAEMESSRETDKMLLNLLKNNNSTNSSQEAPTAAAMSGMHLMEILNKKHTNIINDLFAPTKHQQHPMVLTAQELEFSQLYSNNNNSSKNRSPERNNGNSSSMRMMNNSLDSSPSSSSSSSSRNTSSTCSSTNVNTDLDNSSDAYKQLVKNLSNHPLSTPAATSSAGPVSSSSYSKIDDLIMSKLNNNNSDKRQQQQSSMGNNGTQLLKQLLHLDDSAGGDLEKMQGSQRTRSVDGVSQVTTRKQQHRHSGGGQHQLNKRVNNKSNSKTVVNYMSPDAKNFANVEMLTASREMDKTLLNLLKNNSTSSSQETSSTPGINLTEILNKKHTNIINDLFGGDKSKPIAPKHHPIVLTAQELEFSQLYSNNSGFHAKNRSPERNNTANTNNMLVNLLVQMHSSEF